MADRRITRDILLTAPPPGVLNTRTFSKNWASFKTTMTCRQMKAAIRHSPKSLKNG